MPVTGRSPRTIVARLQESGTELHPEGHEEDLQMAPGHPEDSPQMADGNPEADLQGLSEGTDCHLAEGQHTVGLTHESAASSQG